jgi:hypothetical protein
MTHNTPGWTDWLEDVLAGLLTNGVRLGDIKIKHYPDRTVITVYGIPKYEWKLNDAPPQREGGSEAPPHAGCRMTAGCRLNGRADRPRRRAVASISTVATRYRGAGLDLVGEQARLDEAVGACLPGPAKTHGLSSCNSRCRTGIGN